MEAPSPSGRNDDWRRYLTTQLTVGLVLAVSLLSVLTAVINISTTTVDGPFAAQIPTAVQEAAGFTGALTGFLMVASALALRRGLRAGWWTTLFLLPLTALQGVLQTSRYSAPLIALSLLAVPILVLTRRRFDGRVSLSTTQIAAGSALAAVQLYGTIGTYHLREEFDGVNSLLDAFYFTLITSSTVGYGDITPNEGSGRALLFTMSVIVLGVASFGIAVGALVGPAIQARISKTLGKMTDSQLQTLDNHVLVLGHGDLTEPIIDELEAAGLEFAVVSRDETNAEELTDRGIAVVQADPSDERPLERVQIDRASALLVATNDDAADALTILTARQLRPDVRIVAAATDRENRRKLMNAGADDVISPAELGGHLLVKSALDGDSAGLVERLLEE